MIPLVAVLCMRFAGHAYTSVRVRVRVRVSVRVRVKVRVRVRVIPRVSIRLYLTLHPWSRQMRRSPPGARE